NNTFTGGLGINAGTVVVGNSGALNSASPNIVVFDLQSTGTLDLNGYSVTISGLNTNAVPRSPTVTNSSATPVTLTVNNAGTSTSAGALTQAGGAGQFALSKTGPGTLTLSGFNNTYSGPTMILAGTLQGGASNSFSPNSAVTVASGATLNLGGFSQR